MSAQMTARPHHVVASARRPRREARGVARSGFTLVELLVVMLILALVGTTIVQLLQGQQQFYRNTADRINLRRQVREASDLLPSDLRELSTAGPVGRNDMYAMSDSSVDLRQTFGSTIACAIAATTSIIVPPTTLARGNSLTSWLRVPVAGDSVFVLDDSAGTGSLGTWPRYGITAVTATVGGCPATTNYTQTADTTQPSYTLTVSPPLTATTIAGAPIRFFSRVHYSLHQASDGSNYLGYSSCNGMATPACTAVTPIAGPLLAYSSTAASSGLAFAYYDSLGAATTLMQGLARIGVAVHGQTQMLVAQGGGVASHVTDSVAVNVAVRNRH